MMKSLFVLNFAARRTARILTLFRGNMIFLLQVRLTYTNSNRRKNISIAINLSKWRTLAYKAKMSHVQIRVHLAYCEVKKNACVALYKSIAASDDKFVMISAAIRSICNVSYLATILYLCGGENEEGMKE